MALTGSAANRIPAAAQADMLARAEPARTLAAALDSATALQLQAAILSQEKFTQAAAMFATRLADLFSCNRVSIGCVENGVSEIIAISHGAALDGQQQINRDVAAAMDEAIDQAATLFFPYPPSGRPRITLAHAALARRNGGSVYSIPMVCLGSMAGAVTLERSGDQALSSEEISACEQLVSLAGPVLALKRDSQRPWRQRAQTTMRAAWTRLTGPGEPRLKAIVAGAALSLGIVLLVPLPYSISAPARLEGSIQRALVAAADGFVQQVSVRPGDVVKQGQMLVELAQQDLQLERSKWESELAQQENAYRTALARADRPMLMVNQAKVVEARAQLALAEKQIERTQIKAPFDGVVISGDLTQSLGAPVERGGVLLTVAPLDHYRLIVEVDERDVADVKTGTAGRISLTALPSDSFSFRTERITPVAITRDGRHFFEVEGKIESTAPALRPGLQGVAKIEAGKRSLVSALAHRPLAWLRLNLWSWGLWR